MVQRAVPYIPYHSLSQKSQERVQELLLELVHAFDELLTPYRLILQVLLESGSQEKRPLLYGGGLIFRGVESLDEVERIFTF